MGTTTNVLPPTASSARRRPSLLVLLVAFIVLVIAPLSLLLTEFQVSQLRPATVAGHLLRSDVSATDAETFDCHGETPSRDKCIVPLLELGEFTGPQTVLYPEEIFQIDWSEQVTRADVLHLGLLQRACTTHKDSVIPWNYGHTHDADPNAVLINRTDDQPLIDALRQCPSLDIYVPGGLRGQGYCEDAAAYTKYAHARMLPRWVFELELFDATTNRTVKYHNLCPHTPLLMLNHYWDGLRHDAAWPAIKPLYLMPNIEMFELEAEHYWQADVVLCKTVVCADYLAQWYRQEGNPRLTRVLFTRHTTSDVATNALVALGQETVASDWQNAIRLTRKNFTTPQFVHTVGGSSQKGTARVFDCWLARPDLPRVDIYLGEAVYERLYRRDYEARLQTSRNIHLHVTSLNASAFGLLIANAAFFLCPSRMEGYGHYINQARAAGGLVLTSNVPPMNELVTPASGVLITASRDKWKRHFLGGASSHALGLRNVSGFVSRLGGKEVCAAVDAVLLDLTPQERETKASRARQQYLYDTAFFVHKMQTLRVALLPREQQTPQ